MKKIIAKDITKYDELKKLLFVKKNFNNNSFMNKL